MKRMNKKLVAEFWATEIIEAEEVMAEFVLIDPRFIGFVQKIRQEFILEGFFKEWYGMDGRLGRIDERKSKGDYLFKDERSAFLLWLRLSKGNIADRLWKRTMRLLKILDMDFPEYLTRMMYPIFSKRDITVIFEAVGREHGETMFLDIFPFLAPPSWFEILNYAIFNHWLYRLPVYKLEFTDDLKLRRITFLSSDLSEESKIWLIKQIDKAMEKQIRGRSQEEEHLEWLLLRNLTNPYSIRKIAKKYHKSPSTISSAIKAVDEKLHEETRLNEYMSKVGTISGLSWMETMQIAERAFSNNDADHGAFFEISQSIIFCKNMMDLADDIENTENYSMLGIRPIQGNILHLFVHKF